MSQKNGGQWLILKATLILIGFFFVFLISQYASVAVAPAPAPAPAPVHEDTAIAAAPLPPDDDYPTEEDSLGTSLKIPSLRALFETTLASRITADATSFSLTSARDKDGNLLSSSTYPFIIDEGTANEELVMADCTSTACTNATRGLSVLTGTTTVSALKKTHSRGASVKITDGPILLIHNRLLLGIDTFPNLLGYDTGTGCTSGSPGNAICDASYVRSVAGQGAATSTETYGGIVELGTAAEQAASYNGGADKPTVMQTRYATSTPIGSLANSFALILNSVGKIAMEAFDLTKWYHFSQAYFDTASSTAATTTTNFYSGGRSVFDGAVVFNSTVTGVSTLSKSFTAGETISAGDALNVMLWPAAAIAFDAKAGGSVSGNPTTVSFTVGNNSNRYLVAFVSTTAAGPPTLSSATYNGSAMSCTAASSNWAANPSSGYVCSLAAPATGTHDLVFNFSGSPGSGGYVIESYYNVSQTGNPVQTIQGTTNNCSSNSVTGTITPKNNASLLVGAATASPGGGIYTNNTQAGGDINAGDSGVIAPPAANTITSTSGTCRAAIAIELKPVASGAGGRVYKADATDEVEATSTIGFANEAGTAGNAISVLLNGVISGLTVTPGAAYYITNTPGAISTTAGTMIRKICVAVSGTECLITHNW